jgi:hypothetical protein
MEGELAMASSLPALLAAIERGNGVPERRRGVRVLMWLLVGLVTLVLLAAFLGGSAYGLWQAWQRAEWSSAALDSTCGVFPLLLVFVAVPVFVLARRNAQRARPGDLTQSARLLPEMAATDDEQIAPLAPLQPVPLGASGLSGESLRIGPLMRPLTSPSGTGTTLALVPTLVLFVLLFAFIPLFSAPGFLTGIGSSLNTLLAPLIVAWLVISCVPMFVVLGLWTRRQTFFVSADAHGVRWRRQGHGADREAFIPWSAVRALVRIMGPGPTETTTNTAYFTNSTNYLLIGPDVVLIWLVRAMASEAEAAASEALLRLSVTNSGKPLRDLSVAAKELAQVRVLGTRAWSLGAVTGQDAAPASLAELARRMQQGQKPRRTGLWVGLSLATILLIALTALPFGASAWLQNYQSQYFATLPGRVLAEHPLFTDSLNVYDGIWPDHKPSATTNCGYKYLAVAAYELYGTTTNYVCYAYAEQTYGDVAVEVTATEGGTLGPNLTDGVGLLLRGDADNTNYVAFFVLASGEWDLWHYQYVDANPNDNWNTLASGHSSTVNTGFGASNRLLVLMRGQVFLLYVNDHLLQTYDTQYDDLPATGHMGVYLNEASISGMFTDFAVYPVQPMSSFWYV